MSALQRIRQLASALRATITPADRALVESLLNEAELRLFERMARFDQRHVLDVCRVLQCAGHCDPALLQAALLHDCGKVDDDGRPIPLVYYGLFVVLQRVAPAVYQAAAASGRGPLRPFRVHAEHERRSLHLARTAASSPATLSILADYRQAPATSPGALLSWADDQC